MKKSTKAALLSGLLFPGVGLYFLKHYVRGSIFFIPALIATLYIIKGMLQVSEQFSELAHTNPTAILNNPMLFSDIMLSLETHMPLYHQAVSLFIFSWIISIASSYFAGKKQELQSTQTTTII